MRTLWTWAVNTEPSGHSGPKLGFRPEVRGLGGLTWATLGTLQLCRICARMSVSMKFSSVSWCLDSLAFGLISGITEGTWVMNQPFHLPSVGTDMFFLIQGFDFSYVHSCLFLSPFSQTWCLTLYLSLWSVSSFSVLAVWTHLRPRASWFWLSGDSCVWEAEIEG